MTATYINRNGNVRFSSFGNNPKVLKNKRDVCGARTRKGAPCQAPPVWNKSTDLARNGRCKLHGGLSTGPKTEAGKEVIRVSNKRRSKNFS